MVEPQIRLKKLIGEFLRLIVFIAFVVAALLVFRNIYQAGPSENQNKHATQTEALDEKSQALKKYILANAKPQRIEITNLSHRYAKEVENFKNLKIPQDKNSNFYISIQFFTDEGDKNAPLVAQIRFIDVKSGNTIKEECINL